MSETGFSADEIRFFHTFGFAVMRQLLTTDDIEILEQELAEGLDAQYPDRPFDGTARQWSRLTDQSTPRYAALMEDPRFLVRAQQLRGADVIGIGVDGNRYVGDTRWHPDTGQGDNSAVKFIFYFDAVTATSGALRVIPGSHLLRGAQEERFAEVVGAMPPLEVPCQAVETEPGDAIVFDIRTWHASFGGSRNRRSCNLDYFANPRSPKEEEALVAVGRGHGMTVAKFNLERRFNYSRNWLDNPHRSPVRQRWIDRLDSIGYLDQPFVGER